MNTAYFYRRSLQEELNLVPLLEEMDFIDIGEYLLEERLVDDQPVIDIGLLDHLAQLQRLYAPHLAEDEVRVVRHQGAAQHSHSQTRHFTFLQEGLRNVMINGIQLSFWLQIYPLYQKCD